MFSGCNEILLIVAIVLALIFIPRIKTSRTIRPEGSSTVKAGFALSGRQRLAILVSIVWITFWAVYYEPWHKEWKNFVYFGTSPLLIAWGLWWVRGSRRHR